MNAERQLRRYDKALRLRPSMEDGSKVLLERKTFRGRVGCHGPNGETWRPDAGRRREEGHVLVATIDRDGVSWPDVLDTLKETDTWQGGVPLWQRVAEADDRKKASKVRNRKNVIENQSHELWEDFCWRYRSRVNVPIQLERK